MDSVVVEEGTTEWGLKGKEKHVEGRQSDKGKAAERGF